MDNSILSQLDLVGYLLKGQKNCSKQIKDRLDAEFCEENNIILHRIKYNESKEKSIKQLISDYDLSIM